MPDELPGAGLHGKVGEAGRARVLQLINTIYFCLGMQGCDSAKGIAPVVFWVEEGVLEELGMESDEVPPEMSSVMEELCLYCKNVVVCKQLFLLVPPCAERTDPATGLTERIDKRIQTWFKQLHGKRPEECKGDCAGDCHD